MTRIKRVKYIPLAKLIKKADILFSLFIRKRDATDLQGKCCTCGAPGNQAGHYIKRSWKKLRYDPRNVHLQCCRCNHYLDGNQDQYAIFLVKKYGPHILFELSALKVPYKPTREELQEVINAYSERKV